MPSQTKTTLVLTLALLLTGTLMATAPAQAQAGPRGSELSIRQMTYQGTGCQPNSVAHNISPDGQALTLMFDSFQLETASGLVFSKVCDIELNMHVPSGWSFSVLTVGFRGYAALEKGVTVNHNTFYRFDNNFFLDPANTKVTGPYDSDYERFTEVPLHARTWSRCSPNGETKRMRIRTSLMLIRNIFSARANGYIAVDSFDGAFVQNYKMAWKRCR